MVFNTNSAVTEPGASRLVARCEQLANISSSESLICRKYLSEEHKTSIQLIKTWMNEAGIQYKVDDLGNLWGCIFAKEENAPSFIIGSNLDAISNNSIFDGVLGLLSVIEVAELLLKKGIQLPYHIEFVGFGDGVTNEFGEPSICSRALKGQWNSAWLDNLNTNQISLRDALKTFDLNPDMISLADLSKKKVLAYLELHAEKGPILIDQNQPLGVVASIAGSSLVEFVFEGVSGHTGNVPMIDRKDPLVAASIAIHEIEKFALQARVMANVGNFEVSPSDTNLIAKTCRFLLDIRSGQDMSRELALGKIIGETHIMCDKRGISFKHNLIDDVQAVRCSSRVQRQIEEIIIEKGHDPISMVSGIERQASQFKGVTDIGVVFVRSTTDETQNTTNVEKTDINSLLELLYELLVRQ